MRTRSLLPLGFLTSLALFAPTLGCGDDDDDGTTSTTAGPGGGGNGGDGGTVGGGGSGGDVGGGGSGAVTNDVCPGKAIEVDYDTDVVLDDTLVGAADDYDANCVPGEDEGPDVVYSLSVTSAEGGTATISVTPADAALNPTLAVQFTECGVENPPDDFCLNTIEDTPLRTHLGQGVHSIIVEGEGNTSGAFQLTVELDPPACGDGVLNPTETCDVGAGAPNDGCADPGSATACQLEMPNVTFDTCPGEATNVAVGETVLLSNEAPGHTTLGYNTDHAASVCGLWGGRDRVHAITPAVTGLLTATVGLDATGAQPTCPDAANPLCWEAVLSVRADCEDFLSEIQTTTGNFCIDAFNGGSVDTAKVISVPVEAGVTVYLVVDGYGCSMTAGTGPESDTVMCTPAFPDSGAYNLFLELEATP